MRTAWAVIFVISALLLVLDLARGGETTANGWTEAAMLFAIAYLLLEDRSP